VYLYEHRYPEEERPTQGQEQGMNGSTPTIRLTPPDHVVIARHGLSPGTPIPEDDLVAAGIRDRESVRLSLRQQQAFHR
jgi:hypothetical protein